MVPSRLKCTAVTGSECADSVFNAFPTWHHLIVRHHIRTTEEQTKTTHSQKRTSRYVPDDNRLVIRARNEKIGMRVVVDAKDVAAMALQCLYGHTAVHVPYSDGGIVGCGCEERAIGGPGNIRQSLAVSLQCTHYLTCICRP